MTCCDTADTNVTGKEYITIISFLLLLVSSAEIILGSLCFVFVLSINVGAFWAGAWGFITALTGLAAKNKGIAQCAIVLASLCICVGIVGTVIDGTAAAFFTILTTCAQENGETAVFFGSRAAKDMAAAVACATTSYINTGNLPSSNCYCVYNGGCNGVSNNYCDTMKFPFESYSCYNPFRLNFPSEYNCGDMMGGPGVHYVQMLSGSAGLCGLITMFSFILAILGCVGVCYAPPSYDNPNEHKAVSANNV